MLKILLTVSSTSFLTVSAPANPYRSRRDDQWEANLAGYLYEGIAPAIACSGITRPRPKRETTALANQGSATDCLTSFSDCGELTQTTSIFS